MTARTLGAGGGAALADGAYVLGARNPMVQVMINPADQSIVLPDGVIGVMIDGSDVYIRVGDGDTPYSALPNPVGSNPGGGAGSWGSITGALANQADIVAALAAKAAVSHEHNYVSGDRAVTTVGVLKGGGALDGDLALSLDGDTGDTPAVDSYYGTDGAGTLGFHPVPAGGSGGIDGVDDVLTRPAETFAAIAHNTIGAITPDWAAGSYQRITLAANVSAFNRPGTIAGAVSTAAYSMTVDFVQDLIGGRSVSINTAPGSGGFTVYGGVPAIGSAPGEVTTLVAATFDGGASWILYGTNTAANVGFDTTTTGISDTIVQTALARALNGALTAGAGLSGSYTPKAGGTLSASFAGSGTASTVARSDHGHVSLVPAGGTTGQVLTKASGTDYDAAWDDATGGGGTTIAARTLLGGDFTWNFDAYRVFDGGDFLSTF